MWFWFCEIIPIGELYGSYTQVVGGFSSEWARFSDGFVRRKSSPTPPAESHANRHLAYTHGSNQILYFRWRPNTSCPCSIWSIRLWRTWAVSTQICLATQLWTSSTASFGRYVFIWFILCQCTSFGINKCYNIIFILKVNEKVRAKMFSLRQTWNDVFTQPKLYALDLKVNGVDPAWPITAKVSPAIHVNPNFLKSQVSHVYKNTGLC